MKFPRQPTHEKKFPEHRFEFGHYTVTAQYDPETQAYIVSSNSGTPIVILQHRLKKRLHGLNKIGDTEFITHRDTGNESRFRVACNSGSVVRLRRGEAREKESRITFNLEQLAAQFTKDFPEKNAARSERDRILEEQNQALTVDETETRIMSHNVFGRLEEALQEPHIAIHGEPLPDSPGQREVLLRTVIKALEHYGLTPDEAFQEQIRQIIADEMGHKDHPQSLINIYIFEKLEPLIQTPTDWSDDRREDMLDHINAEINRVSYRPKTPDEDRSGPAAKR